MYKIFTTLFVCILFVATSFSQLVINEIMYNPPEAGDDSLEYVEIINSSIASVNLAGYVLSDGIGGALPAINLATGQTLLMAKDSVAILAVFGKQAYQWTTGSLNNTGELITIRNANNDVIDEVNFLEVAPWPLSLADGNGASLELCNPSLDNNNGSNWRNSETSTGIILNNIEIKATPGAANGLTCTIEPDYIVEVKNFEFTPKDITINVGQTVRWSSLGGHHNVNGSQASFPSNPASFINGIPSSSLWSFDFTFSVVGVYNYKCDSHPIMTGTVTVIEPVVTIPKYEIVTISSVNGEGVADSLGVICEIEGTVYGINQRPGGLQFTIIDDNNNGIAVFNGTTDFGYSVSEGEVVSITGKIEQFNGLTQIVASDLNVLSQSHPLVNAKEVTSFVENDESSLIAINNLNYVDISQWKGDGTSFNVDFTDGNSTFVVRIDNDCELSTMTAPAAPLKVSGILGQFDSTVPFLEGYQLLPRYAADMITISSTDENNNDQKVIATPNPFSNNLSLVSELTINTVKVYNSKGQFVLSCDNHYLNLSNLNSGFYFLQIMTSKGMEVIKVVKI